MPRKRGRRASVSAAPPPYDASTCSQSWCSAQTSAISAIDPIEEIAEVCAEHQLWLHVDASYGGGAALTDALRPLFRGIERADSVAVDAHKWLYTPHSS